uniref:Uncharacterized protein n=1 Tax=Oryza sativa subsp. japonica TaxID=39947 RepID=Q5VRE5_ORYSJ|nr:hypothetical protein [Oryza sativa Japonica Group]
MARRRHAATGGSSRRRGTAAGGRRTAARTGTATHPKRRRGAAAEVLLVPAELREATVRVGVDRSGGATRLESVAATERGGSRGYGATEVERGNGAVAELACPAAKLAVAAERCGGDPSDGKRRPEFAEVWRRAGAA